MAANNSSIELKDCIRVVFSRTWWFTFVTLGVVAVVLALSFNAAKTYKATNEILVTDKYAGGLPQDLAEAGDWVSRMRRAELDFKRTVPAREMIQEAAYAVAMSISEADLGSMTDSFKNDVKMDYSKEGGFMKLSYQASDARLAAAVLSVFMRRVISSAVEMQVQGLNTEVETLVALKAKLGAEVAAAERKLDEMRTFAPELRLTASTMALLRSGKDIAPMLSTEQAVGVFLQLQRDIINLDSQMADISEQILLVKRQVAGEAEVMPVSKKLEALPAVVEAAKKRDALRLQLTQLMANSTAKHPMVRQIQAELKSLDVFLASATTESTVEVIYQVNQRRKELEAKVAGLQSDLGGLRQRRAKMEENAEKWRKKLDSMPTELRIVREATLEYENKAQRLTQVTDKLVDSQIKRNLELEQVGTYYRSQWEVTPVPEKYEKPNHLLHLALGLVLGLIASVFVVYAVEFSDHSVKDQRDLRLYTKAAVLGVISDYNQLRAVALRTTAARAAVVKQYLLAVLLLGSIAALGYAAWRNWPRGVPGQSLPASLSISTVSNVEEAMRMYSGDSADLNLYVGTQVTAPDVAPAIEVPDETEPQPVLSE